jgi:succinate dehydrogenase / fumarate reductase cytochrome b subunit
MTVGNLPARKGRAYVSKTSKPSGLLKTFTSTIGSKFVVAVTGLLLVGFLFAHLAGNLLIYSGRDGINSYAKGLRDLGPMLWLARIALLSIFALHICLALRLKRRNVTARPEGYQFNATVQASLASRTMLLSGLVILAFVIYHIAHYTMGWVHTTADGRHFLDLRDPLGRNDVYSMVVAGFSQWWVSATYIIAQLILGLHLSHGISSIFQTLGWSTPRYWPTIRCVGLTATALLVIGNISIPIAVLSGIVKPVVGG